MPHALRGINVLPVPKWTQSDNNLLPQWLKYLKWQHSKYGNDDMRQIRNTIATTRDEINWYDRRVREYNGNIADLKQKLNVLKNRVEPTDADIMQHYETLIASPHVIGTRIDHQGALVVLIDPQIEGAEALELGMYELDVRSLACSLHQIVMMDEGGNLSNLFYNHYGRREAYYGPRHTVLASFQLNYDAIDTAKNYDLLPAVESFIESIKDLHLYSRRVGRTVAKKSPTRQADQPWSGFVDDPVRALRRLRLMAFEDGDITSQIQRLESELRDQESYKKDTLRALREHRTTLRNQEAELAKREAAKNAAGIDLEEAARSLEFISTLPSVIAIKFGKDGVPIVHMRNSFVHGGKRYDLGDFEVALKLEDKYFGTVPVVRRTRCPLGGSYNQGWHPDSNAFCFGNRTSEILDAFYAGDLNHTFNLILGTMNGIDADHDYRVDRGEFAEIAMDDVWQRKLRRRTRRRTAKPEAVMEQE